MSFIKITTLHADGREVVGITQQANVTAQEAFARRAVRAGIARQVHDIDRSTLTIRLHPTDVIEYSQLLQYADTMAGFGDYQSELPPEFLDLMEGP